MMLLRRSAAGAHPRSRGEDIGGGAFQLPDQGSSPLARGGLERRCDGRAEQGLIPARAGRTLVHLAPHQKIGAHPRSRGEDPAMRMTAPVSAGSSPLARGGRRRSARLPRRPGLIPARAGRTASVQTCERVGGAHPRSRGEDARHSPPSGR